MAFAAALDRGRATTVAAVTFAVETLVPALVGLVWLGDRIRPGLTWLAAGGFVATLACRPPSPATPRPRPGRDRERS